MNNLFIFFGAPRGSAAGLSAISFAAQKDAASIPRAQGGIKVKAPAQIFMRENSSPKRFFALAMEAASFYLLSGKRYSEQRGGGFHQPPKRPDKSWKLESLEIQKSQKAKNFFIRDHIFTIHHKFFSL